MKNYMTVWNRWAAAKATIVAEHARLTPTVEAIKAEIIAVSGQSIASVHVEIPGVKLRFYPFWKGGFAFTYSIGWESTPDAAKNWDWTLKQTEAVASFLQSLQEEEIKILFRQWADEVSRQNEPRY